MPTESNSCSERQTLENLYHEALRAYMGAVDLLDVTSRPESFEDIYQIAEKARALFESARDAFRNHIEQHGCRTPISLAEHSS